jgi:dienelactone hydrolase
MTRARLAAVAASALLLCVYVAWPYASSAALLLDLSGTTSPLRSLLPFHAGAVHVSDVVVPTRHGGVPARLYSPESPTTRAIVVVPGVHAGGVEEPRLDALSRRLAGSGATVLSLPLPDLRAYRIVPAATDMIEDGALWLADRPDRTWTRVGIIGVSFSGGLAIVAAGRAALHDRLTTVVSLGGHGDLPRALRFLCTGTQPDGRYRRPHEYGVAVMLRAALSRLIPAPESDRAAVDRALVAYLDGSSLVGVDDAEAAARFDVAERSVAVLGEPARSIMGWVRSRDVVALGSRILPFVEALGGDPALSPERSPAPTVPVFLIHGLEDNLIPPSETTQLAEHLRRRGVADVTSLLTPLVTHAELRAGATLLDQLRIVRIWTAIWKELGE